MNFSKAFGCGRITPSLVDGTAEEIFMRGLELVQRHGDNVDWKVVAKYYSRAANEVRETKQNKPDPVVLPSTPLPRLTTRIRSQGASGGLLQPRGLLRNGKGRRAERGAGRPLVRRRRGEGAA